MFKIRLFIDYFHIYNSAVYFFHIKFLSGDLNVSTVDTRLYNWTNATESS